MRARFIVHVCTTRLAKKIQKKMSVEIFVGKIFTAEMCVMLHLILSTNNFKPILCGKVIIKFCKKKSAKICKGLISKFC